MPSQILNIICSVCMYDDIIAQDFTYNEALGL